MNPEDGPVTHRGLLDHLRERIRSGELPPGAAIPSQTELIAAWGLTRFRVRAAVLALRAEGLVTVRQGRPTRVRVDTDLVDRSVDPGTVVSARLPSPEEARRLRVPLGVPVLMVTHPDGEEEVLSGDRYRVVFGVGDDDASR